MQALINFYHKADIIYKKRGSVSAHLSRRMIVAKYVDGITLLQPVEQVERIERISPYNRNADRNTKQDSSFAAMFQKAKARTTTNQAIMSNGFDVLC